MQVPTFKSSKIIYVSSGVFGRHYSRNHAAGATKWRINYVREAQYSRIIGKPILLAINIPIDELIEKKIAESTYWLHQNYI